MRFVRWLFAIAGLLLIGAGCATSDAPSAQPAGAEAPDRTTLDCLDEARRMTPGFGGRPPQMSIDQDRYQRCLSERRQTGAAPAR